MQKDRSIDAQRARLLGKKSTPKPRSDKFVKREIINMKYGLHKNTVKQKTSAKTFFLSSISFGAVLLGTVFFLQPFFSLVLSLVAFFVSLGILNSFKPNDTIITPAIKYDINHVFEKYDNLLTGSIKEKMLLIKSYVNQLAECEVSLQSRHYIDSTVSKDIPDIFSHYSHLKNSDEKFLEQLNVIEEKLSEIYTMCSPDYEKKLEIKARVIKEKANI